MITLEYFLYNSGVLLVGHINRDNVFSYVLSEEDLLSWGWRIPFIFGLLIGLIGLYIRSHLAESPIYKAAKEGGYLSKTPLRETFTKYWKELLMAIIIYINVINVDTNISIHGRKTLILFDYVHVLNVI